MGNLDVKEFMGVIKKASVIIEHPSGMVINASGKLAVFYLCNQGIYILGDWI